MIRLKTEEEIKILREGGIRLAYILKEVEKKVAVGVSTKELDDLAYKLATENGDKPAFLNYKGKGDRKSYPASLCVSINDEVVHGIPSVEKIIKNGDIISLDMGLIHKGLITDSAITVPVGNVDEAGLKLINVTREALRVAIDSAKKAKTIGDIGYAVERFAKPFRFGIVETLCGHGVGYAVHEDPFVPNYGEKSRGEKIEKGLVIAIEPMLNEGTKDVVQSKDGFTFKTKDGKRSAHFEHTIAFTKDGVVVITE
ncbi:MAG: type I methionyl aminopeptidase [Minisyncoccia bacterium]